MVTESLRVQPDMSIGDLIIAISAVPADATPLHLIGNEPHAPTAHWDLIHAAVHKAKELGKPVRVGPIVSSDVFYNPDQGQYQRWSDRGILAVEMEIAGLYGVAAEHGARALGILTVSDHLRWNEHLSTTERESGHNISDIF